MTSDQQSTTEEHRPRAIPPAEPLSAAAQASLDRWPAERLEERLAAVRRRHR